jgi:hypothetical protein
MRAPNAASGFDPEPTSDRRAEKKPKRSSIQNNSGRPKDPPAVLAVSCT